MGNISVKIINKAIDLSLVSNWVPAASHGAANIFLGYVRNLNLGRPVTAIQYDCFVPLCETTLTQIAREAQEKWDAESNILIIHRQGYLQVGEASVAIVATTGHRDEAYQISRYIIEEIKTRAPIWKKEYYAEGDSGWSSGHALNQSVVPA